MNARRCFSILFGLALTALVVAACGPAATFPAPTSAPPPTFTQAPQPTQAAPTSPAPSPTPAPTQIGPTPTAIVEGRVVELEWPPQMRLGDSDVVRLSLIPSKDGYTVTTEFPEHTAVTSTVSVARPGGYDLSAVGRLEGVGFTISPASEQVYSLPPGETVTWRWTLTPDAPGQHRLAVSLVLRWTPMPGTSGFMHDSQVYSKGLDVRVTSFLGLTKGQAMATGFIGLIFGGGLSLMALTYRVRLPRPPLRILSPNTALAIEPHPNIELHAHERSLLQTLFRRYARVVVESEFRSGYSGARTLLALPIRADGRADAHTIVKIGESRAIQREFENYETFVKDTLPPITARIQETPVTTPSPVGLPTGGGRAALRYTFIGEPGRPPLSLRESLIANPDPALLEKLFSTFGPNWWMQRRAHTFRLALEYDRMLPAHYVLEPAKEKGAKALDGKSAPSETRLEIGDCATVRGFPTAELRADGQSLSLTGIAAPGQPPLRLRWMSLAAPGHSASLREASLWDRPGGATGRVVATRSTLLCDAVANFDRHGLPDPLARLPALLDETVIGTQSTIHGDLNLENVLVGPGGFVWLIDFAQTRDGHPLYDFAHLEAEIIAHVIASEMSPADYVAMLGGTPHALLSTLHEIAARCLLNPSQPREYHLALCVACLGALKFPNLEPSQKHLLYLTAAFLSQSL
jgi:hypothetical protein